MWCPEGYVTLAEILMWFDWASEEVEPSPDRPAEFSDGFSPSYVFGLCQAERDAWRNWLLVALLRRFSDEVRACLPSGALVRLHPGALSWEGSVEYWEGRAEYWAAETEYWAGDVEHHSRSKAVSEYDRTIFPEQYSARIWLAEITFSGLDPSTGSVASSKLRGLSQVAGSQLCLPQSCFPVKPQDLSGWLISEIGKMQKATGAGVDLGLGRNVAKLIVEAFEAERVKTKAQAYALFGKGMKHDAWLAYWKEACEIMPGLSKPGPRSA